MAASTKNNKKATFSEVAGITPPKPKPKPYNPFQQGVTNFRNNLQDLGSLLFGGGKPKSQNQTNKPPTLPSRGDVVREGEPGITDARVSEEQARLESEQGHQARAGALSQDIGGQLASTEGKINSIQDTLNQGQAQTEQDLEMAQENINKLPQQVAATVDASIDRFQSFTQGQIGEQKAENAAILEDVNRGQALAMSAAVQGIQGNINSQIAQINADPNIPPSQKQTMISQVRLGGATQMGTTVGNTILQFNTLQAQTATTLQGQLSASRNQAVAGTGQLIGQGMSEISGAYKASKELGLSLINTGVNSRTQYAAQQSQLEGLRTQAQSMHNNAQLALLPEMDEPIPMFSDIWADRLDFQLAATQMDMDDMIRTWGMNQAMIMQATASQDARTQMMSQVFGGIGQLVGGPTGGTIGAALPLMGGAFGQPTQPQNMWSVPSA